MLFHFDRRKKSEKEKKPPRFLVLRRKWLTLGAAVLAALDGSTPVLAAVKPKDTDFLRRVRQHPHGEVFNITPESREALYQHLRSRILQWNKEEL